MQRLLTIIIPIYNEELTLPSLFHELDELCSELKSEFDVDVQALFIDNLSDDRSWEIMKDNSQSTAKSYEALCIRHFVNLGMQESLVTGIRHASGNAIAILQADLQDPISLIKQMVSHWISGDKFIATRIIRRNDPVIVRIGSWLFYRILRFLSNAPVLMDSSDFYLFDTKLRNTILASIGHKPFVRTTLASVAPPDTILNYVRREREEGVSNYNHRRRANFAIDAFLSNLGGIARKSVLLSLVASALAAVTMLSVFIGFLLGYTSSVSGWLSSNLIALFSVTLNLFLLSILLEIAWRIYNSMPRKQDSYPLEIFPEI